MLAGLIKYISMEFEPKIKEYRASDVDNEQYIRLLDALDNHGINRTGQRNQLRLFGQNINLDSEIGVAVDFSDTDKEKAALELLDKLTDYLLSSRDEEVDFLIDIGSLEKYVYDTETSEYILAEKNPQVGSGYHAEGMMLQDLTKWAPELLSEVDYQQWQGTTHRCTGR